MLKRYVPLGQEKNLKEGISNGFLQRAKDLVSQKDLNQFLAISSKIIVELGTEEFDGDFEKVFEFLCGQLRAKLYRDHLIK